MASRFSLLHRLHQPRAKIPVTKGGTYSSVYETKPNLMTVSTLLSGEELIARVHPILLREVTNQHLGVLWNMLLNKEGKIRHLRCRHIYLRLIWMRALRAEYIETLIQLLWRRWCCHTIVLTKTT
jgi:hypothetical protein